MFRYVTTLRPHRRLAFVLAILFACLAETSARAAGWVVVRPCYVAVEIRAPDPGASTPPTHTEMSQFQQLMDAQ